MYDAPTTLNKCEFQRTLLEMFKYAQYLAIHILPPVWVSHNYISISHSFRHIQTQPHTHTKTHTHIKGHGKLPSRNLFEINNLENEGDRTVSPYPKPVGTVGKPCLYPFDMDT